MGWEKQPKVESNSGDGPSTHWHSASVLLIHGVTPRKPHTQLPMLEQPHQNELKKKIEVHFIMLYLARY